MNIKDFKINDLVAYMPDHRKKENGVYQISFKDIGIVTSKNDKYVFVRYFGDTQSKATKPEDLFKS